MNPTMNEEMRKRAKKTARELREAARDLERALVECNRSVVEDLLEEFEAMDESQKAA